MFKEEDNLVVLNVNKGGCSRGVGLCRGGGGGRESIEGLGRYRGRC